jgi:hypothetical protein
VKTQVHAVTGTAGDGQRDVRLAQGQPDMLSGQEAQRPAARHAQVQHEQIGLGQVATLHPGQDLLAGDLRRVTGLPGFDHQVGDGRVAAQQRHAVLALDPAELEVVEPDSLHLPGGHPCAALAARAVGAAVGQGEPGAQGAVEDRLARLHGKPAATGLQAHLGSHARSRPVDGPKRPGRAGP